MFLTSLGIGGERLEIWTDDGGDAATLRMAGDLGGACLPLLELSPSVLARALDAFPGPGTLRTLDALHLVSCSYLVEPAQGVALASYDRRMNAVARAMGIPRFDPEALRIA